MILVDTSIWMDHLASVASPAEVLQLLEAHSFFGRGIGYVDAHLLVAARLTAAQLWTRNQRLRAAAVSLGLAYAPPQ